MEDIGIRTAELADLEQVLHQRRAMFEAMGRGDASALDRMEAASRTYLAAALADGTYRGWLAEVDGSIEPTSL